MVHAVVRIGSNIGKSGGGFEYLVRQEQVPGYPDIWAQRVIWGRQLEGSGRELLEALSPQEASQQSKAVLFLERTLKAAGNAGVAVKDLKAAAEAHCVSWRTIERARQNELADMIKAKQNEGSPHAGWSWIWTGPVERAL